MTNKEAADVLRLMSECIFAGGRGNGKTQLLLSYTEAIGRAIKALEDQDDGKDDKRRI